MTTDQQAARSRILTAAAVVFARKGYGAAGIREIAQEAGVNISMISYYFGGKEGVLKEIINQAFARYIAMLDECLDPGKDLDENIRCAAHGLIRFFRERTEEAIVAFDIMPLTIPESLDLIAGFKLKILEKLSGIFGKAGFGMDDPASYGLVAGTMPMLVLTHFQGLFAMQETGKLDELREQYQLKYDDAYFNDYADKMADFVLGGIERLKARNAGGEE
ncbi:MAG: TetR/AcrR family transcriptional regulator [candidate division WOR-3 bacterium]|nr:MAG: TetR/AcrR family transcriptional regulator [candidate division WOR-3 bacterium]